MQAALGTLRLTAARCRAAGGAASPASPPPAGPRPPPIHRLADRDAEVLLPCQQALNLIKAGYEVTVWNRSADKCAGLQAAGAKVRRSAGEALAGEAAGWVLGSVHLPCLISTRAASLPQVAGTPAEVVAACDITLAMLSDPEACLAVAKGAHSGLEWCGGGGQGSTPPWDSRRAGGSENASVKSAHGAAWARAAAPPTVAAVQAPTALHLL